MSIFTFDNKTIYYTEQGSGTPLLLLHGNTASSNLFYEIAPLFARNYRVVLIDFLGHGESDRLEKFPTDLWFFEAQQVIAFLIEKKLEKVNLIGTSGGALVAINVALEAPELVNKVVADSFQGEASVSSVVDYLKKERQQTKADKEGSLFYYYMHGDDWESVIDKDTEAVTAHFEEMTSYFHKDIEELKPEILLTGSREDEFMTAASEDFQESTYKKMLNKIKHGSLHMFDTGSHPAMLTNMAEFVELSNRFFRDEL